jgi:hypothetical protein
VDLDSLLGRPGALGGDAGWAGPLNPEACRRLACDGALTRVLVTRQPRGLYGPQLGDEPLGEGDLAAWLQTAIALLPPTLGGAPSQPLDVGRASRVVTPAQRSALAVRDGGCVFPDCHRPLAWCEGHHLVHWLDGGRPDQPRPPLPGPSPGGPRGRLAADPRPRRPLHRHPTPSAPPTTSHRRLNRPRGRVSVAASAAEPAHRARRAPGPRTLPTHRLRYAQGRLAHLERDRRGHGTRRQPQNRLWAPNRAAGSQATRGPRYIRTVR